MFGGGGQSDHTHQFGVVPDVAQQPPTSSGPADDSDDDDDDDIFFDPITQFPVTIEYLEMLVENDRITDLIPYMEAAMLEELEDLQNAAAVTADLLLETMIGLCISYELAFRMSCLRWSDPDYMEIIIVTERLDRCKEDLQKLPMEDLQRFAKLNIHLGIAPERLIPSPSAYQVLHECRRALTVKARSDRQLLRLLQQSDWKEA